ncbi:MAG: MFS transporter [Dysgonamonadaceae bacterium]|jgi:EmrB/QacA subfamily drug resistance transporter|nr:MFS transporter [Dysgonamonadaceae bacterium]
MKKKEDNKNQVLFVLCLSAFFVPFMGSAINLSLPQISSTYSLGAVSQSWIAASYLIATAILQVPFARMGDLFGRRLLFITGLSLFCISNILCGIAPSGAWLIAFRALSGVGCAMIFGVNMAILVSSFPIQERGKAIGVNTAVVYFALAAGPFLGGLLTQHFGWQSLFFFVGFMSIIAVVYSFLALKTEWIEAKGERFDFAGSSIYSAGLFFLIFGFSKIPDFWGFIFILSGISAIMGFVFFELKTAFPVFDVRIFSGNKVFCLSNVSALINYACTYAITFLMSLYLQYVRGFEPQTAGLILIVQALVQCVASLYSGILSDKTNPSLIATCGMALIAVGLVTLVFVTVATPLVLIILILVLFGLGFGLFSSPNSNVIISSVDKRYYGQASATMGTMRLTGQAFSMGIATMSISLFVGNKEIISDLFDKFMTSFHTCFLVFAVLCSIGVYTSMFRVKK